MMMRTLLPALAAALLLSACGYKGDLYLPKESDRARIDRIIKGAETGEAWPDIRQLLVSLAG